MECASDLSLLRRLHPDGLGAGADWDKFSDGGGYAHLTSAAAQWIFVLEGKRDWEQHFRKG